MKVVLSIALLCCIFGGIESNCENDENTRGAYCRSVYAFKTKVLTREDDRENFYVYKIDINRDFDFKHLVDNDGNKFSYSFDTVYVDKHDCGTLQENTAYLLIGDKKESASNTLKIVAQKGQVRKWESVNEKTIEKWLRSNPSCPRP